MAIRQSTNMGRTLRLLSRGQRLRGISQLPGLRQSLARRTAASAQGFSLAEALVTMSIFAIGAQAMSVLMVSQYKSQARLELRADANHSLEIVALKLEQGKEVDNVGDCSIEYGETDFSLNAQLVTAECSRSSAISATVERLLPLAQPQQSTMEPDTM